MINNIIIRLQQKYFIFIQYVFLFLLFGLLSFGRSFSHIYAILPHSSVSLIEIILFISFPVIFLYKKSFLGLPKLFLSNLVLYFLFGIFYLFFGFIILKNPLALRDAVLCVYILFFPLTLILFSKEKIIRLFLYFLIAANILMILVGRLYIFGACPISLLKRFIALNTDLNFQFQYGMATSFLIAFFSFLKKKRYKFIALLLLSLDLYMIIIFAKRSAWIGCIALLIFYVTVINIKFFKFLLFFIPLFIVTTSSLYYLDFKTTQNTELYFKIAGKALSMKNFLEEPLSNNEISGLKFKDRKLKRNYRQQYRNIKWRFAVWESAVNFGAKNPVFGRGFGVYPECSIKGGKDIFATHNHLISIFYKMGISGLVLFVFTNIYALVYGLLYLRKCRNMLIKHYLLASLGAFIFWHITALSSTLIDLPSTSIFLWVIMGFIFCSIQADKVSNEYSAGK